MNTSKSGSEARQNELMTSVPMMSVELPHVLKQFASGKSLWRSLMNDRAWHLSIRQPVLDLGAGAFGSSSYHNLVPGFSSLTVRSVDIAIEKHPSIMADTKVHLPLRDSEFQTCLAFNLFEHLYEFENLLQEIFRVLAPGGRLYIAVPFLLRVHPDPDDYARYTKQYLERRLAEARFSNVIVEPLGWGAVTAALSQVDFLVVTIFRALVLRISVLLDKLISRQSGGAYRNASDYPIGYFASATKPIDQ